MPVHCVCKTINKLCLPKKIGMHVVIIAVYVHGVCVCVLQEMKDY